MSSDSRTALEFSHNVLNLPMTASSLAGTTVTNTMTYTYLGDGTRVGARVSNPDAQGYSGMRYRGSFVYDVTADPLAHKYFGMSPYNYCGNDPVNFFDPTGMNWYSNDNGGYLWRDSTDDTYTDDDGNTWTNVGSTLSIDMGNGQFQNWFENVGFQANSAFNAEEYILSHNLVGQYISTGSNLCNIGKHELFTDNINYGRQSFLDHPVTQTVLSALGGMAVDGIFASITYVSSCSLPGRVFRSGGTMNEAQAYAVCNGMTTLEITNQGRFLT